VPERKLPFRQNPNLEYRNPKQIRISKFKTMKYNLLRSLCFVDFGICILVIVSYFVLRISNFLTEASGFGQSKYANMQSPIQANGFRSRPMIPIRQDNSQIRI